MTTYPINGTRRDRLLVWLAFKGVTLQRRKGIDLVRIARRGRSTFTMWLKDAGSVACFVGSVKAHRSIKLERLMREWNQAEMHLPGATHDYARIAREGLADKTDVDVQSMADYYAQHPIGLEAIGAATVRLEFDARKRRMVERRFVMTPTLCALVTSLGTRQAYVAELVARDLTFAAPVVEVKTVAPVSLPFGQLSLFAEAA